MSLSKPSYRRARTPAYRLFLLLGLVAGCDGGTDTDRQIRLVRIIPGVTTLRIPDRVRLQAIGEDGNGNVVEGIGVTWTSSDVEVLAVNDSGDVEALWPGSATIVARLGDLADSVTIDVHTTIATLSIDADSLSLIVGDEHSFPVRAFDSAGVLVTRAVAFTTEISEPTVADLPHARRVRGLVEGIAELRVAAEGIVLSVPLRVSWMRFAAIHPGFDFFCGLTAEGRAACWGGNTSSQLGVVTPPECVGGAGQYCYQSSKNAPVWVGTTLRFASISGGDLHNCATATDAGTYCWGNNSSGQLGTTRQIATCYDFYTARGGPCSAAPVRVEGQTFVAVSAGDRHTCGVTSDAAAFCWGSGADGVLGNGSTQRSDVPVAVSGGHAFATVSAGRSHSCGVTASGAAHCWGSNRQGSLGLGSAEVVTQTEPAPVSGDLTFVDVRAGGGTSCGLTADGKVFCWGHSDGLGTTAPEECGTGRCATYPVPIDSDLKFTEIAVSGYMNCALSGAGLAYCWTRLNPSPTAVTGAPPLRTISAGGFSGCGMGTDDVAYCWSLPLVATRAPGQPSTAP